MARKNRFAPGGFVVHVTVRGVNRCRIFYSGFEKRKFLGRLALLTQAEGVEIHGYCLMNNHAHLLLRAPSQQTLSRLMLRLLPAWASFINRTHKRSGHLFQDRFHSCVLDEAHYWNALRYVDANPRKHLNAKDLASWEYSSARARLTGEPDPFVVLMMADWRARFTPASYAEFLAERPGERERRMERLLKSGLPCAEDSQIAVWEKESGRRLRLAPPGRRPKCSPKPCTPE
jgi:putative transposase